MLRRSTLHVQIILILVKVDKTDSIEHFLLALGTLVGSEKAGLTGAPRRDKLLLLVSRA